MAEKNINKQGNESSEYYFAAYIDNKTGEVTGLLLTRREFERAAKRAEHNPEDLYKNFIIAFKQGIKNVDP